MTSADGGAAEGSATRPTVRGRDTQARLEQAGREVIARKGFFKTTITDITSAARRSPAVVLPLLRIQGGPAGVAGRGLPGLG